MNEIIEILSDLHPDIDFETAKNLVDNKILDSFDIVSLIAEINDNFDVAISAEEITPENFNSAESIWALVERLMED
ncbi:MAG: acyl carrier protein [Lachnospiraceae bacterium]|nr:acyl carrier protein [Lachnospiraceae bacterium]